MILTGNEIEIRIDAGEIVFEPFVRENVNPNSIDLRLGPKILRYLDDVIDPRTEARTEQITIPQDGLLLDAGTFWLGSSEEVIGSNHYVPLIHGKSSTARAGLFVHVTADLIDIGSIGNITFQLFATRSIRLFAGMRLAQATFWQPKGEIRLYDGKYQGSRGPQKSHIYKDHFWKHWQEKRS